MRLEDSVVAAYLNLFPEVLWDRFVETESETTIYGWIERETRDSSDVGRSDFMMLTVLETGGIGFTTSSVLYSHEFAERLYGPIDHHVDCQRVCDRFRAAKRAVGRKP